MARPDKSGMIDGFMSVQAVRRKNEHPADHKPHDTQTPQPQDEASAESSASTTSQRAISHTALPSRHELVCYSCSYAFVVTGRLDKVFCPKCREALETGDHTIEGECNRNIRTVGTIHIRSGAKVTNATLVATDIIVGGDCAQANLEPTRKIILDTGASVPAATLRNRPVQIRTGARIVLPAPLRCSDLDVHGELQAEASPSGMTTIHSGGHFRGTLQAEHLSVHEGGGLHATLRIAPQSRPKNTAKNQQNSEASAESAV